MRVKTGGRTIEIPDERMLKGDRHPHPVSPLYPYKSKLEAAFARSLEFDRLAGVIVGFQYEPMNIRLSDGKNFYKPDFLVWSKDNRPTFYEVKGRNRSDERSLVKTKVAASLHPWARFILVKRIRGSWVERDF